MRSSGFPSEEAADFGDRTHHRCPKYHRGVLLYPELVQHLQIPPCKYVILEDVHDYFAQMGCTDLIGHSGPLLGATKDIDISEAALLAKLVLS